MKLSVAAVWIVATCLSGPLLAEVEPEALPLIYDVVQCKGKLYLETGADERRLKTGDHARSGDQLRTGWWSGAQLEVSSHGSRFLLGSRSRFSLTHDRPGVLLHVERGRLRTVFGVFTGDDPRLVTTPSAVLAVRGTEYGVQVAKNGDTHVVVFSGVVEVSDAAGAEPPFRLTAGHQTRIVAGKSAEAPTKHGMTAGEWDRGRNPSRAGADDEANQRSFGPGGPAGAGGAVPRRGGSNRRGG